jgi:sigma54-dependent transcription regulator
VLNRKLSASKSPTFHILVLTLFLKENKTKILDEYEHILKSSKTDTFYPMGSNGEIIFDFKFASIGKTYLEGVLEDEIVINTSDTTDMRIIKITNHINLPIFVTDDKDIIDNDFSKERINKNMTLKKI